MKLAIILSLASLLIGFSVGKLTGPPQEYDSLEIDVPSEKITSSELRELDELRAQKEKYLQSEQLLSQALMIFLANIGIKMTPELKSGIKEMIKEPQKFQTPSKAISPEIVVMDPKGFPERNDGFVPGDFHEDESSKDADFKDSGKLNDPAVFFARSRYIEKYGPVVEKVNGIYRGEIFISKGKRKGQVESAELHIDFFLKEGKHIDGKFSMQLSRDGLPYSTTSGEGGNRNLRLHPQYPKHIIIEAGPGDFFHFKSMRMEKADFYMNGKFVGKAKFTRI